MAHPALNLLKIKYITNQNKPYELEYLITATMSRNVAYSFFKYLHYKKLLDPVNMNTYIIRFFKEKMLADPYFNTILGIKLPEKYIHLGMFNINTLYYILGGNMDNPNMIRSYVITCLGGLISSQNYMNFTVNLLEGKHIKFDSYINTMDTTMEEFDGYHPFDIITFNKYVYTRADYPYLIYKKQCPYTKITIPDNILKIITEKCDIIESFTEFSFAGRPLFDYINNVDGFEMIPKFQEYPSDSISMLNSIYNVLLGTNTYQNDISQDDEYEDMPNLVYLE